MKANDTEEVLFLLLVICLVYKLRQQLYLTRAMLRVIIITNDSDVYIMALPKPFK